MSDAKVQLQEYFDKIHRYRLGKYSYARETDRSRSRALPPMNARLGMLEAIIMTVIPKQSQLKMVRFKILTEDHLYE